jgi:hypothetical protein
VGLFAIMDYFFNVRVDSLFVPAVLKVIGFAEDMTSTMRSRKASRTAPTYAAQSRQSGTTAAAAAEGVGMRQLPTK